MSELEAIHVCQVPGCNKPADQYSLPDPENLDAEVFYFYCHEHAHDNGFCWGCGGFYGGNEEFEFSKLKLCGDCEAEFIDEYDETEDSTPDLQDFEEDEEEEQEPKPLMRCRTCKFKFNQARHTTYQDSEQWHVQCPKCGRVYLHDDFELQPEDYAMMDLAQEELEKTIAAGIKFLEQPFDLLAIKPAAIKTENVWMNSPSRTYYENLPREQLIEHCQKCYEYNLKAGNEHLAEFWKQELEKAKGREN